MDIEAGVRYERTLLDARLTAKAAGGGDDDSGWIEGYASAFDVVDEQREVVRSGAFAKTIMERVGGGKVKLMVRHLAHGGGVLEVIGTITEAKEDFYGLWIHADLSARDLAQEARQLVLEGHIGALSIGYIPVGYGFVEIDGKEIMELTEIKLMEVTVTAAPINDAAVITAAKAVESLAEAIGKPGAPDNGRATLPDRGRLMAALESVQILEKTLAALLVSGPKEPSMQEDAVLSAAHSWKARAKAMRHRLQLAGVEI